VDSQRQPLFSKRKLNTLVLCSVFMGFFWLSNSSVADNSAIQFVFSEGDPPTSYSTKDNEFTPKGLLPEITEAAFNLLDDYEVSLQAMPWKRAKLSVIHDYVDGIFTYPSDTLKERILFTDQPAYISDFGYIIFNKENFSAHSIKTINDLTPFTLLTESTKENNSWEEENIPSEVKRVYVNKTDHLFHLIFLRNQEGFFVRNLEEAQYIAKKLGYSHKLGYKKMTFKSDNSIAFHFGIRRSHPQAKEIIGRLDELLKTPILQNRINALQSKYQNAFEE